MKKMNNRIIPLLIVLTLLTFDFLYKNQGKDTASSLKESSTLEEIVGPDQNNGKENTVRNPFILPQSLSEKGFQSLETSETEEINTKFSIGIIL